MSAAIVQAFALGYSEGMGDLGMTYDGSPCSPRSTAYDYGRTLRRSVEGIDDGGEDPKATRIAELEGALASLVLQVDAAKWPSPYNAALVDSLGYARRALGGGK